MLLRRVLSIRRRNPNRESNRSSLRSHQFNDDFTGNCKSVSYYLSNIEKHLDPRVEQKGKPKKKHLRALTNLKLLLNALIRDLENNSMGLWFNELVCDQQRGHEVLVKLLSSLVRLFSIYLDTFVKSCIKPLFDRRPFSVVNTRADCQQAASAGWL